MWLLLSELLVYFFLAYTERSHEKSEGDKKERKKEPGNESKKSGTQSTKTKE